MSNDANTVATEELTIGQLLKKMKPSSAWKCLGALFTLVVGAFSFGLFIDNTLFPDSSGIETDWYYEEFPNTDLTAMAEWISGQDAGLGDVQAAVSVNTFHVWVRRGSKTGGHWKPAKEGWNDRMSFNVKDALDNGDRIVIGSSGNNFHYLRWIED